MRDKFQTNFNVTQLYGKNKTPPQVTKIGILPFITGKPFKVLTMKPRTEAKHLGAPAFQIAKGTRRININEGWCDMREEDLRYADESFYETLIQTALREGEEEVGLKASNIKQVFDMGGFTFISASRGIVKPLHMFAAEIIREDDFAAFEVTTSEVRWMTMSEFSSIGRPDHVAIVDEILGRLETAFFAGI
jgi:hypothetical protein